MFLACLFFSATAAAVIYTLSYTTLFRSHAAAFHCCSCEVGQHPAGKPTYEIEICNANQTLAASGGHVVCDLRWRRAEEHTSELQSQSNIVCRLLLEQKRKAESPRHKETF